MTWWMRYNEGMVKAMRLPKIVDKNDVLLYEKEFAVKEKAAGRRLIVTPDKDHVKMMLTLLDGANKNHGYSLAYFLVGDSINNAKKYDAVKAFNWDELETFCKKYSDYLETDARHNFGIRDNETKDTVIYDNHNILHVFGNLEAKIKILENNGYKKVEKIVRPKEYGLFYHPENDAIEKELINKNDWKVTSVKIHDPGGPDDDWDKEIEKKSLIDRIFDYLEKETV